MQPANQLPEPMRKDVEGGHLIQGTPSVLSPIIWMAAAQALPGEVTDLVAYLQNWSTAVRDSGGLLRLGVASLALTVLAIAIGVLWFWWQRQVEARVPGRLAKALSSLGVFLCLALITPLLMISLLEATEVRMFEISYGLIAGIMVAAFGRGAALGVFAPDASRRRLITVDDLTARSLAGHLVWGTRALGVLIFGLSVHRLLAAPAELFVTTNMLFVLVIGALLLHLLLLHWHSGRIGQSRPLERRLRIFGWFSLGAIAIALIVGEPTLAALLAAGLLLIPSILSVFYLLLALSNALWDCPGR